MPPTTRSKTAALSKSSASSQDIDVTATTQQALLTKTRSRQARGRRAVKAQERKSISRPIRPTTPSKKTVDAALRKEFPSTPANWATFIDENDKILPQPTRSRVSKPSTPNMRAMALLKNNLRVSTRTTKSPATGISMPPSPGCNISSFVSYMSMTKIQGHSPLLRLPAEIRNIIYRMALISPMPLLINGSHPQQPGLTRTCRQIRAESLRIFYTQNKFSCSIQNYDPSIFKRYRKAADQHGLSTVVLTHQHVPGVTRATLRKNLLEWLMGTYVGETAPLGYSAGYTEDTFKWEKMSHRIVKVFNLARELRKARVSAETAMAVFENAVDCAGVCGEKLK